MKKKLQHVLIFGFLMGILAAGLFAVRPVKAYAAYSQIPEAGAAPKKIGNYYFWTEEGHIRFSTKLDGSYRSPMYSCPDSLAYTDGSNILFLAALEKGQWLVKYSISSHEGKGIRQMPGTKTVNDTPYSLRAMVGNYVIINNTDYDNFTSEVYSYNISSKKWNLQLANGHVCHASGSTMIIEHGLRTDVSPFKASIYKFSSGKLKKVKSLGNYCLGGAVSGKYIYYALAPSAAAKSATVYRIKLNGTGRKSFGKISKPVTYAHNFTSKSCVLSIKGTEYRYTYKTKKLKKISSAG